MVCFHHLVSLSTEFLLVAVKYFRTSFIATVVRLWTSWVSPRHKHKFYLMGGGGFHREEMYGTAVVAAAAFYATDK